ncbi:MAG: hypothetical protein DRH12_16430 [Deltaproteobacteria bacterium]|nr:MAG: hypothetical protein DRH12_16430 [Deltaproteobacteria bacterium]
MKTQKVRRKKDSIKADKRLKTKAKRLSVIVDEFLEVDIDRNKLSKDHEKTERLLNLLVDNLWEGKHSNTDFYWLYEDIPKSEIVSKCYERLSEFWAQFKRNLFDHREKILPLRAKLKSKEKSENIDSKIEEYSDNINDEQLYFISVKYHFEKQITVTFENDEIHFVQLGKDVVDAFIELINGLPASIFKKCKYENCKRCFILTSRHKKEFCCRNCASKWHQKQVQKTDPEGYRAYHRDYYQKRKELLKKRRMSSGENR